MKFLKYALAILLMCAANAHALTYLDKTALCSGTGNFTFSGSPGSCVQTSSNHYTCNYTDSGQLPGVSPTWTITLTNNTASNVSLSATALAGGVSCMSMSGTLTPGQVYVMSCQYTEGAERGLWAQQFSSGAALPSGFTIRSVVIE